MPINLDGIITQGQIASALLIIAIVLVYLAFAETSPLRRSKNKK